MGLTISSNEPLYNKANASVEVQPPKSVAVIGRPILCSVVTNKDYLLSTKVSNPTVEFHMADHFSR